MHHPCRRGTAHVVGARHAVPLRHVPCPSHIEGQFVGIFKGLWGGALILESGLFEPGGKCVSRETS
jgi:hypothetical protein